MRADAYPLDTVLGERQQCVAIVRGQRIGTGPDAAHNLSIAAAEPRPEINTL